MYIANHQDSPFAQSQAISTRNASIHTPIPIPCSSSFDPPLPLTNSPSPRATAPYYPPSQPLYNSVAYSAAQHSPVQRSHCPVPYYSPSSYHNSNSASHTHFLPFATPDAHVHHQAVQRLPGEPVLDRHERLPRRSEAAYRRAIRSSMLLCLLRRPGSARSLGPGIARLCTMRAAARAGSRGRRGGC